MPGYSVARSGSARALNSTLREIGEPVLCVMPAVALGNKHMMGALAVAARMRRAYKIEQIEE
jgi:hypothetical protein